jgi:hypothetical protein
MDPAKRKSGGIAGLLAGDTLIFAIVTIAGFAQHNELESAGLRMLTTFLPLVAAWLLLAPFSGVFAADRAADPRQLWRPFYTMLLAAPLAAWIRGAWLNQPVVPIFVLVLGGISALALLAWRTLYWWITTHGRAPYG